MEILAFLYEQGSATSEQLIERYFSSRESFWVRIGALTRAGLVSAERLSQCEVNRIALGKMGFIGQCGADGFQSKKVYRLRSSVGSKQSQPMQTDMMLLHQLWLNQVRQCLFGLIPNAQVKVDPEIRRELGVSQDFGNALIPDLVVSVGNRSFAIEVERTRKAEVDYFSKFLAIKRSRYEKALFFVESDSLFRRLSKLGERFEKIGFVQLPNLTKVYSGSSFSRIESFLSLV